MFFKKIKNQFFWKEGKKITWWCFFLSPSSPHHNHTPQGQSVSQYFFILTPCASNHPSTWYESAAREEGEGEGFLGGFCAKQRWRAGSLLSPALNRRHLPPPQAGGSHPRATGGVGCGCGVGMTPPTKTMSFLESTKVFNFFFLQDFSIFS